MGIVCIISGVYFFNDRMNDYYQPVLIAKNHQVHSPALLRSAKLSEVETTYLQNKFPRYYFIAGMSLSNDELFLSQIDLNVVNGVVQQPIQPTIQAVSKAKHKQMGKGLLVINYSLMQLLNSLWQLNNADTSIKVAVGTMRWILHLDKNKKWSLDLYREPANVVIEEPGLWTQLKSNLSVKNQVLTNHLYSTTLIPFRYDQAGGLQNIFIVAKSRDGLLSDFRGRALAYASRLSASDYTSPKCG